MITFKNLHDYGRFGNRLFFVAGTIGLAVKFGYRYAFEEWEEREVFINQVPYLDKRTFDHVKKIPTVQVPFYYVDYKHFPNNCNVFGFMQNEKYFKHCEALIRDYFEMKPIAGLPKIETDSLAIHFRGGDYGGEKFPRLTIDYYKNALLQAPKTKHIYVFSDEVETAREMLGPKLTYIETGNYISDFYLMRQCKHFVIGNSTYAWWAAWLGKHPDKKVVAPRKWYSDAINIENKDIHCDGWLLADNPNY